MRGEGRAGLWLGVTATCMHAGGGPGCGWGCLRHMHACGGGASLWLGVTTPHAFMPGGGQVVAGGDCATCMHAGGEPSQVVAGVYFTIGCGVQWSGWLRG